MRNNYTILSINQYQEYKKNILPQINKLQYEWFYPFYLEKSEYEIIGLHFKY